MMRRLHTSLILGTGALALAACDLGPKESTQTGYRGTGMVQIEPVSVAAVDEVPAPPYDLPPSSGVTAAEAYQNVQVLGAVSREEFDYLMAAITEWVAPEAGCNYCHNPANMASDEVYTKVVARRMLQMNRAINADWSSHVRATGVTCWTCHRGNAVPQAVWSLPENPNDNTIIGNKHGQNTPDALTAYSSLPGDALARFFSSDLGTPQNVRVGSATIHPTSANTLSVMQTEQSYALMMHLSQALGVNCTHCHNSQSFREWSLSSAQRERAWYGIRMVRDINDEYITSLQSVFPANRLGSRGDPYKASCVTCHQGNNKPLNGVQMVADYPALRARFAPTGTPAEIEELVEDPEIVEQPGVGTN